MKPTAAAKGRQTWSNSSELTVVQTVSGLLSTWVQLQAPEDLIARNKVRMTRQRANRVRYRLTPSGVEEEARLSRLALRASERLATLVAGLTMTPSTTVLCTTTGRQTVRTVPSPS